MIPLRLETVTKRFGPVTAVDGVSLAVKAGEPARVHLAPEAIRVFVRENVPVEAGGEKTAGARA